MVTKSKDLNTSLTFYCSMVENQLRGVVEGFYGKLWTPSERINMIEAVSNFGGNSYVYGPKFDQKHLKRWGEPYSDKEGSELTECANSAASKGVDFYWAVSPGTSEFSNLQNIPLEFSSKKDLDNLLRKFDHIKKLGIEHFAIFFDDISPDLKHDSDVKRYGGSMALAQADLVTRLSETLGEGLIFVPTVYRGTNGPNVGSSQKNNHSCTHELTSEEIEYLKDVGDRLAQDIMVAWTGPAICSETISSEDAKGIESLIKRKPLIWDNYPVSDFALNKIHLGPVSGRSSDLMNHSSGILFNPMDDEIASEVGVITGMIYAESPEDYNPESAHEVALSYVNFNKDSSFVDLSSNSFLDKDRQIDELVKELNHEGLLTYAEDLIVGKCPFEGLAEKIEFYANAVIGAVKNSPDLIHSQIKFVPVKDLAFMITNSLRTDLKEKLKNPLGFNAVDKFWNSRTPEAYSENKAVLLNVLNSIDCFSPKEEAYVNLSKASLQAIDEDNVRPIEKVFKENFNSEIILKMCNGF